MIGSTKTKMTYEIGTADTFPFPIRYLDAANIECHLEENGTTRKLTSGEFEVIPLSGTDGANIRLILSPLPAGAKLTVRRILPLVQLLDLPNTGKLPAESVELQFDKLVMITQQQAEELSRCVMAPIGSGIDPETLIVSLIQWLADAIAAAEAAQRAADAAEAAAATIDVSRIAYTDQDNYFTGMVAVPDTAKGTSSGQAVNTRSLLTELGDFVVNEKIGFTSASWQLVTSEDDPDHGKYRRNLVTDIQDYTHVYRTESYGSRAWDHMVEVQIRPGFIRLLTTDAFPGHIVGQGPRVMPTYNYAVYETGLALTGLAANPRNANELHLASSAEYAGADYPVLRVADRAFAGNLNIGVIHVGSGIREIGTAAFSRMNALSHVDLPPTLRAIGEAAFYTCPNLTGLTLPEGLLSIGNSAFGYCPLTTLNIPSTVTTLGGGALAYLNVCTAFTVSAGNSRFTAVDGVLYNSAMTTLIQYPLGKTGTSFAVPAGVTTLGQACFEGAGNLQTLSLPEGLSVIGNNAFASMGKLSALTIPSTVTTLGSGALAALPLCAAFTVSAGNGHFTAVDGVLYNTAMTTLIQYPAGKTGTSFAVPATVTEIAARGFGWAKVQTITLPSGLLVIRSLAFSGCAQLAALNIPSSVSLIETGIANGCVGLTAFTVSAGNGHFTAVDGVLYNSAMTALIQYPAGKTGTSFTVPAGVTTLGNYAFHHAIALTGLTLPASLATVESYAFEGCIGLTTVEFPAQTGSVGAGSFTGCTGLTDITFRNPATVIEAGAFSNCPNLMYVHGYPGSTASAFAASNTLIFVPIE